MNYNASLKLNDFAKNIVKFKTDATFWARKTKADAHFVAYSTYYIWISTWSMFHHQFVSYPYPYQWSINSSISRLSKGFNRFRQLRFLVDFLWNHISFFYLVLYNLIPEVALTKIPGLSMEPESVTVVWKLFTLTLQSYTPSKWLTVRSIIWRQQTI